LRQTAVAVVERYTGVLPSTVEELQSLPGIGSYTAAAVAAFAFGRRVVVLDTNIRRVLARAIGGEQLPPPAPLIAERRRAEAALPADPAEAVVWNMSLMELGALVCTARSPRCESCPIACDCAWHQAGGPPDSYAAVRRTQPWLGSDRQARGRVMAQLRAEGEGILAATVGDLIGDSAQAERAVAGLLADGLARRVGDRFMLPSE
jgi:A/G-specific adenine glycosylase